MAGSRRESLRTSHEQRIAHVVVVMFENRSFDHVLGFLAHPDPNFRGVRFGDHHNVAPDGTVVPVTNDGQPHFADPDHSHEGVMDQLAGYGGVPSNGGFVRSYATLRPSEGHQVMRCLDPARQAPMLAQLAREFAVCDNWFSSVPGETWPNRNFAHAATSDSTANIELGFYNDRTIFELIESPASAWRIYHEGMAQVWCFRELWRKPSWMESRVGRRPRIGNWYGYADFFAHVASGDLPAYSFVEPVHIESPGMTERTNSQHPNNNRAGPRDFYAGDQFIGAIYESLRAQPALFAKTLLVITYDEHGGFYDHVPPPAAVPPGDPLGRGISRQVLGLMRRLLDRRQRAVAGPAFGFDRLGVRIPAVLVSPWIRPGTVVHTQLEHASIPATLRALFRPSSSPLTARDRAANTFHEVVRDSGLQAPRADLPVLEAPPLAAASPSLADSMTTHELSDFDRQLVELQDNVNVELVRDYPEVAPVPPAGVSDANVSPELRRAADTTARFRAAAEAARASR
ncbi:MAG: hypothetical protein M3T56_14385 [Chloroflexota bacterium]|nr:hypothetical protein [Chloroflexota bacterium]